MYSMKQRAMVRGFTLIELLVVISIIALLIGILLPSLGSARRTAQGVLCLSNMRQMSSAAFGYAHDNKSLIPSVGFSHGGKTTQQQGSWFFQLEDSISDGAKLIYRCPSDRSVYWDEEVDERLRLVSYATPYTLGNAQGFERFRKLTAIPRPSSTIFAVELTEGGREPDNPTHSGFVFADHVHPETWTRASPSTGNEIVGFQVEIEQHNGRANYAFLDGHAAAHTRSETFENETGSVFNPQWVANLYWPDVAQR